MKRVSQRLRQGKVLTLWVQRDRASEFLRAAPTITKPIASYKNLV